MQLSDILADGMMKLKKVSFENNAPLEEGGETFSGVVVKDSLTNVRLDGKQVYANYIRRISSENEALEIVVNFEIAARTQEGVVIDAGIAEETILNNLDMFVAQGPAEASLIIANLLKGAGFPALIYSPAFIEE